MAVVLVTKRLRHSHELPAFSQFLFAVIIFVIPTLAEKYASGSVNTRPARGSHHAARCCSILPGHLYIVVGLR